MKWDIFEENQEIEHFSFLDFVRAVELMTVIIGACFCLLFAVRMHFFPIPISFLSKEVSEGLTYCLIP